jgi:hypothetical protein
MPVWFFLLPRLLHSSLARHCWNEDESVRRVGWSTRECILKTNIIHFFIHGFIIPIERRLSSYSKQLGCDGDVAKVRAQGVGRRLGLSGGVRVGQGSRASGLCVVNKQTSNHYFLDTVGTF